jgi:hypothetical protein
MAENELRKHLREALAQTPVGLNTDELAAVVKHLEKHGVTVEPKSKPKEKK